MNEKKSCTLALNELRGIAGGQVQIFEEHHSSTKQDASLKRFCLRAISAINSELSPQQQHIVVDNVVINCRKSNTQV